MPYIIETRRNANARSRRAVATLDEAQDYLMALAGEWQQEGIWPNDLTDQGGTIPVPDGTIIEVRQVEWLALWKASGLHKPSGGWEALVEQNRSEIINAFNAF